MPPIILSIKQDVLSTLFIGYPTFFIDEIDSTNQWAFSEIGKGTVTEGTLYRAGLQTAGKGQRGRKWDSLANQNLLLSYVLIPKFLLLQEQFKLTMAVSLAIKATLDVFLPNRVSVKWPNDIYVDNQKIAGVLIESSSDQGKMATTVVGIGLNINQRFFDENVNATSLLLETGVMQSLDAVLDQLNVQLEKWYVKLRNNSTDLHQLYTEALFRLNQRHLFEVGGNKAEYKVMGVNKNGQLLLADNNDVTKSYHLFEVKMIV